MQIPISVQSIGKRYHLGEAGRQHGYRTLRESLSRALTSGFRGPAKRPRSDTFWALSNVTFDVSPAQVVGIIGRNGAGKSTLLKILSRTTSPTLGQIEISGRVGSLLEVGTGFHPELTGRENILLSGSVLGMRTIDIKRKLDQIVAFAEVERMLDTPVKRYSSGMYVRLAFAVAAHLEPDILIIDEVLAVGDSNFQRKCLGKISDMSGNGRTVLFVSHNMAAVSALCDRAIWLEEGQIIMDGLSRDVVDAYLRSAAGLSGGRLDLKDRNRPLVSSGLRFSGIEWATGLPLRHNDTLRLLLHFSVAAPLEDLAFGVGFSVPGGNRVLTYDSDTGGVPIVCTATGEHTVELRIDSLPLAPGTYSVDVAARSGSRSLEYLHGCMQVDVCIGDDTPASFVRHPGVGVRYNGIWSSASASGRRSMTSPAAVGAQSNMSSI